MNDDPRFLPIEERLQAEAEKLLFAGGAPPSGQLRAELQRGRAARRRIAGATTLLAAGVLGSVIVARQLASAPHPKQPEGPAVANFGHLEPNQHQQNKRRTVAVQPVSPLPRDDAPYETLFVVPFVIDDPASGKPILSGFYVPEQVEPIDLRQLPPAERDAIRAVLDIDDAGVEVL